MQSVPLGRGIWGGSVKEQGSLCGECLMSVYAGDGTDVNKDSTVEWKPWRKVAERKKKQAGVEARKP